MVQWNNAFQSVASRRAGWGSPGTWLAMGTPIPTSSSAEAESALYQVS